jgi:hypothetical protein
MPDCRLTSCRILDFALPKPLLAPSAISAVKLQGAVLPPGQLLDVFGVACALHSNFRCGAFDLGVGAGSAARTLIAQQLTATRKIDDETSTFSIGVSGDSKS